MEKEVTMAADVQLIDVEVLSNEEFQEQQANRISQDVFGGEKNAIKTGNLITQFVTSYEENKHQQPLNEWLISEFRKHPDIWNDEAEITATAQEVIYSVQSANDAKASLHAHLDKGKSQESWLAQRIEKTASANGAVSVGDYAMQIEDALVQGNEANWNVITRVDGGISQAYNLDGFIAEHHHANTFNLDAAAKGSKYRARVLEPEAGQTYGKNSMDIGIYDGNGKLVRRYQSKYGADANTSAELFEKGDYRGQRKLVPEGHADANSSDMIEIDGVRSKPLSKEQAKAYQAKAQAAKEARQYEWNEVNRIDMAKSIGKQALVGACITAGLQGARIVGRRVWNALTGKGNPPASEDLKDFFESSVKSTKHVGVQVAVSGAVVVAAKNGLVGSLLKGTPAGMIANIAYVGMENAKVLYKYAKGEVSGVEALNAMGHVSTSTAGGIYGAVKGAAIGSAVGPVGAFVGAVVGGMAGSKIGEAVFEGGKAIVKTAAKVLKTAWEGAKETVKAIGRALNPLRWFS